MKTLTIELVKGQKQEFKFLGWKDDGSAFYATGKDGKPAVIVPWSAYPANCNTGQPYRFPNIVPLEIIPKKLHCEWSPRHLEVLRRWRDSKLAEVEAMTEEQIHPSRFSPPGVQLVRTPAEIEQDRQYHRNGVERDYKMQAETPLLELTEPTLPPFLHEDFAKGRWADELGQDFREMFKEARSFWFDWQWAYDSSQRNTFPQRWMETLFKVRYVMRGEDERDYHLVDVKVRIPTDREAQAYVVMQQLAGGVSGSKSANQTAEQHTKPNRSVRFEKDFSLAVVPQRKGDPLRLAIEPELQTLVKRIIDAGGEIPRTQLREDRDESYQPEKLLRSKMAKALVKAGLLGKQRSGRTTVFWAKERVE